MAYPPSVPSGARINTTPQVNLHPADHVAIHAALTDILNELGSNPSGDSANLTERFLLQNPVGVVTPYAGSTAPSGWHLCDGTALIRANYPDLFAVIGETFGAGDGSTTFNLPDLTSKFVAGKGGASWSLALNDSGGSANAVAVAHTHTTAQHRHSLSVTTSNSGSHAHVEGSVSGGSTGWLYRSVTDGSTFDSFVGSSTNVPGNRATYGYAQPSTGTTGSTHSHTSTGNSGYESPSTNTQTPTATGTEQNLPPYLILNYIIRLA